MSMPFSPHTHSVSNTGKRMHRYLIVVIQSAQCQTSKSNKTMKFDFVHSTAENNVPKLFHAAVALQSIRPCGMNQKEMFVELFKRCLRQNFSRHETMESYSPTAKKFSTVHPTLLAKREQQERTHHDDDGNDGNNVNQQNDDDIKIS